MNHEHDGVPAASVRHASPAADKSLSPKACRNCNRRLGKNGHPAEHCVVNVFHHRGPLAGRCLRCGSVDVFERAPSCCVEAADVFDDDDEISDVDRQIAHDLGVAREHEPMYECKACGLAASAMGGA